MKWWWIEMRRSVPLVYIHIQTLAALHVRCFCINSLYAKLSYFLKYKKTELNIRHGGWHNRSSNVPDMIIYIKICTWSLLFRFDFGQNLKYSTATSWAPCFTFTFSNLCLYSMCLYSTCVWSGMSNGLLSLEQNKCLRSPRLTIKWNLTSPPDSVRTSSSGEKKQCMLNQCVEKEIVLMSTVTS